MWKVLIFVQLVYASSPIISVFEDHQFLHLVVNKNTGTVYVGGVNNLYQLSPDLNIVQRVVTGPVNDSILCSFNCDDIALEQKDNFNKVLVIDYDHDRLITCGSVFQGMCSVRSLRNIHIVRDVPTAIAANDPTASTVSFLAPGPPDPNTTQVMYIGVTFSGSLVHRHSVPAVSSRSLEDHRLFDIAVTFCEFCHSDQVTGTRLYINTMYRDQYIVNYVYGFSSGAYSYFLTTQRRPDGGYYSKIIRICHDDEQYYSYTEMQVSCKGNEDYDYDIVMAGFVTKPDEILAQNLRISRDNDVLYTLFRRKDKEIRSSTNISALCIYSVRDINEQIGVNIERCFNGEGLRGLEYVWPDRKCVKHKLDMEVKHYYGSDINSPLEGNLPIETKPVAEFNETILALAVTVTDNLSRVFAGTAQGHLKKIMVVNATSAAVYGSIVVDEGSPVNKDLVFDTQQRHLYVMTGYKISKVRVHECSEHKTCTSCISAGDPYKYCGWCFEMNKCSPKSDCKDALGKTLGWLPYNMGPCTVPDEWTPNEIQDESIVATFINPVSATNSRFNHLAVDYNTGTVFIGAVNRIYQLSYDLGISLWVHAGPVNGSNVGLPSCQSKVSKHTTDNVNIVLLIDYSHSRLIACGSALQGLCSVRSLSNITHDVREVCEPIGITNRRSIVTDIDFSPVAFLVNVLPNPLPTQVMYLGALSIEASDASFPVVTSRSLEDHNLFKLSYNGLNTATTAFSNHFMNEKDASVYSYVYGFSSGLYNYFLRTEVKTLGFVRYSSVIIRVCHEDDNYSYIEVPISCEAMSNDGKRSYTYKHMVAAFVSKPGSILAEELGITVNEYVLFAFFRQRPGSSSSAFCIYPFNKIGQMFRQVIKTNFGETGSQYLDINKDVCEPNINTPLWGEEPIVAIALLAFPIQLTAVVVMNLGNYTVVFAGTANGHLKKIVVESATSAFEYDDIVVDQKSPIKKDLFFDSQNRHLYVMTDEKVMKLKVYQCNKYKLCSNCVIAREPYCGWCVIESKCSLSSDCEDASMGSSYWLEHGSKKCKKKADKALQSQNIIRSFSDPLSELGSAFNHLAVDHNTGRLYVGAVNRIYQLSPVLEVTQWIATGPVNDSSFCFPDCPVEVLTKLTNNVNKVLLIDYAHKRLITCSSTLQSIFSVRDLSNISNDVSEVYEPTLLPITTSMPIVFIGTGPHNLPSVMYIGVETLDDNFPVINSLSLEDHNLFEKSINRLNTNTTIFFDHFNSDSETGHFTYGFSSGRFNYFIKRGTRGEKSLLRIYFSRIISVCYENDKYSYTEIPISCKKLRKDGKRTFSYNHMMAGYVSKPGHVLAKKLGITIHEDVLFAAFHSGPELTTSALCIYPIKKIRQMFLHNIKKYINDIDSKKFSCHRLTKSCNTTKLQSITEDFCGPDINMPIWGQDPIEAEALATFTTRLTAVATTVTGDYTVVFVGTEQGSLKKIVVKSATSAHEYGNIVLDKGSSVNKDLVFDPKQMHLYVMTERKVFKVPVHQCSEYESYIKCVGSRDPYCGWCEDEERCALQTECQ